MNAIFVADDTVLRVSQPSVDAHASVDLALLLSSSGLRVAVPNRDDVVVVGDLSVTCWDRIEPTLEPIDWSAIGAMIRRVHDLDVNDVPNGYPVPLASSFPWWDFDSLLDDTRPQLDERALIGIERAIAQHNHWTQFDDIVVCHGDVHPGNVMMTEDGPVLIDWDLLCLAPASWDHAPMMTWHERWGGRAGEYETFADGYGRSFRADPTAEAFAELRLVAATLMRVRAGRSDPVAAIEAERRLAYWRGDSDAPNWRAQ